MNEREAAWLVLQRVEKQGGYASLLLERHNDFVRHLVLGVLRWRGRLDAIAAHLANRTVAQIDQPALQLLRIGLYQIAFMNVPDHAAVSETMSAASAVAPRAKPFINAILRRATRANVLDYDPPWESEAQRLAFRYAHPLWMVERWVVEYGAERTERIVAANQQLSHPDLLVNTRKITMEQGEAALAELGVPFERSTLAQGGFRLRGSTRPLAAEISGGLFYPMDEASIAVAALLVGRGQRILDIAAAPGGKSLVLALSGARVTSHDISIRRTAPLRASHRRFFGRDASIVVGDARSPAFRRGAFDTVLIDAPCSATGTIRKSPEIKWRLQPEQLAPFAALQERILSAAAALEPQEIFYATCSLEREENDEVIESADLSGYRRRDLAEIAPAALHPWISDGMLRLAPDSGADGFTAAWLARG